MGQTCSLTLWKYTWPHWKQSKQYYGVRFQQTWCFGMVHNAWNRGMSPNPDNGPITIANSWNGTTIIATSTHIRSNGNKKGNHEFSKKQHITLCL